MNDLLIDKLMPHYHVRARYQVDVHAPVERAYSAARRLDMSDSIVVRCLFRLRGLPDSSLTFDGLLKMGFMLLGDKTSEEIVFGLIGRFWTPFPQLQRIHPDGFAGVDLPGFAKAVGNMAFIPSRDGSSVRVTTETRVQCLCDSSRRSFGLYWRIIGPFGGIIRKEWLRMIKRRSEAPTRPR